jgi:hypothetical protein
MTSLDCNDFKNTVLTILKAPTPKHMFWCSLSMEVTAAKTPTECVSKMPSTMEYEVLSARLSVEREGQGVPLGLHVAS